jgi:hypothetical protein
MPFNFHKFLLNGNSLKNMPPVRISNRDTDKTVTYNKNLTRLDRIAGDIYQDETLSKVILWANPAYFIEFDIPDNTIIRIPFPINDVISEVTAQIVVKKDK